MSSAVHTKPASAAQSGPADLVLPAFLELRPGGIYVDTASLPSGDEFLRAVDRIFSAGYYFSVLDYPVFQRLLFNFDPVSLTDSVRLASEIREFPEARRALYKGVKLQNGEAHYIFEPAVLESTVDEPVYGIGEDGTTQVVGSERKVLTEKTSLDVDEFIADMWAKGVRFGINLGEVEAAIAEGSVKRVVIARELLPTEGADAGIEEQTNELHRDNAPRETLNGRVDLRQFTNRFPQISKGTVLLKKTPRVLGEPGRTVEGKLLEPDLPKDFDMASLAGEGTRIEHRNGTEYIVALKDGFLTIDSQTNRISVNDKIVNREGVSIRTTGNLSLAGEQYEEFGEVQEGRVVEGKSLTFHSDVFGKVISSGGHILLEKNLVGGSAVNRYGSITVAGLISNAAVQTTGGVIHVKRAENSVLVGDRVELEWACNCTILADEVDIGVAEACAIAGKRIHLGAGHARNGEGSVVSVLMPDVSGIQKAQDQEARYLEECGELASGLKTGIERLTEQPDVRKYFLLAGKLHRKEITLTPEQQGPWQQMSARLAPTLKRISQARQDLKSLDAEMAAARERITALDGEKEKAAAELECQIDKVLGDLVVRAVVVPLDSPPLASLQHRELKQRLRTSQGKRLFSGNSGTFSWKPENAGSPENS